MIRLLLAIVLVVAAVYTAGTALTQVQPGERAVVRRFGRILPDRPAPGLYVGWPWGIDVVERVPVGMVRRVTIGFRDVAEDESGTPAGQILTGDHNLVNAQAEIHYTVREDEVARFALQADRADGLVVRVAESVLAEWVAGRPVDEVLLRGKARLPTVLVEESNRRLADYALGVQVEQASLTRLNPPDEVRDAFERVAQAQTGIVTQINQASQEAESKRQGAQAESYDLARRSKSYADAQVLEAKAEAQAFLRRLGQYRALSRDRGDYLNVLWRDEVTRLFAKLRETGQIDLLDHHLSGDGLNITQFPLGPRKK